MFTDFRHKVVFDDFQHPDHLIGGHIRLFGISVNQLVNFVVKLVRGNNASVCGILQWFAHRHFLSSSAFRYTPTSRYPNNTTGPITSDAKNISENNKASTSISVEIIPTFYHTPHTFYKRFSFFAFFKILRFWESSVAKGKVYYLT
jgi:hypothetical protein